MFHSRPIAHLVFAAITVLPIVSEAHFIAVGGGPEPELNQVSLEQDIALARSVLGKDGEVFFAAGSGPPVVQVLEPEPHGDDLVYVLGDVFDPRPGRDSNYRPTRLENIGAATLGNIETALARALRGKKDILLYAAMHGNQGQEAKESRLDTWGGESFTATQLAEMLDEISGRATARVVLTACHSGGFAEIAFAGGEASRGPAKTPRCGLFAADWDQIAGGCDPNPNRGAQDGYGVHFLNALKGEARDGSKLDPALIDFDGDGRVSLLEAHSRARIESSSFGVPVTTSERWLRSVGSSSGNGEPIEFPEEDAVIRLLGTRLVLHDEAAVVAKREALEQQLTESGAALREANTAENEAAAVLRIALLEKWPVLDDPWHPRFPHMIESNRGKIRDVLENSASAMAYQNARRTLDARGVAHDDQEVEATLVRRLARSYETRRLAGQLRATGGEAWAYYQRLRACERWVPGP